MKHYGLLWDKYKEECEVYAMSKVFWYKTEDNVFVPFMLNFDKTKITILTTGKEFEVIRSPISVLVDTYIPQCDDVYGEPEEKILYKPNIVKTLKQVTGKSGKIFDSVYVLENYYFSNDVKSAVKTWVNTHELSQREIITMAEYVNKDLQKQLGQEK